MAFESAHSELAARSADLASACSAAKDPAERQGNSYTIKPNRSATATAPTWPLTFNFL